MSFPSPSPKDFPATAVFLGFAGLLLFLIYTIGLDYPSEHQLNGTARNIIETSCANTNFTATLSDASRCVLRTEAVAEINIIATAIKNHFWCWLIALFFGGVTIAIVHDRKHILLQTAKSDTQKLDAEIGSLQLQLTQKGTPVTEVFADENPQKALGNIYR